MQRRHTLRQLLLHDLASDAFRAARLPNLKRLPRVVVRDERLMTLVHARIEHTLERQAPDLSQVVES